MFLTTHSVRLSQKRFQTLVSQILYLRETKAMNVVARSNRFDSVKERMIDATLEPQTAVQPILSGIGAGKSHSYLERDARLLRYHSYRSKGFHEGEVLVEEPANNWLFAFEVPGQRIAAARMPHVWRDESVAALWTRPEWTHLVFRCSAFLN